MAPFARLCSSSYLTISAFVAAMTSARPRVAIRCRNASMSNGPAIVFRIARLDGARYPGPKQETRPAMTRNFSERRAAFRALHQDGCFVLPNPWDVGSARMLQHLGFVALASTSAGFAWTTGRCDCAVPRSDVLDHLALLCNAVDLPVNADFESGFAGEPEGVAASVALAIETGVAGLSIEDRTVDGTGGLFDLPYSVERIRAARAAIDRSSEDVILVARTEGLL